MSYSIDEKTTVLATKTGYSYSNETQASTKKYTATLSDLTEGAHYLIVYAEYDYDVHIITSQTGVHFTIETDSETTPEIPEFSSWTVLPLLLIVTLAIIILKKQLF